MGFTGVVTCGLVAASAEAAPQKSHGSIILRLVDEGSGFCLDNDANGKIYTSACNGSENQRWRLDYLGGTSYTITSMGTKRVLTSDNAGNISGAQAADSSAYQTWNAQDRVYTNAETARVLDSNAAGQVYSLFPNGGAWQRWAAS